MVGEMNHAVTCENILVLEAKIKSLEHVCRDMMKALEEDAKAIKASTEMIEKIIAVIHKEHPISLL
jgi:hypothetical protein